VSVVSVVSVTICYRHQIRFFDGIVSHKYVSSVLWNWSVLWVSQSIAYEVFKKDNGSYLKTGIGSPLYDPRFMVNS